MNPIIIIAAGVSFLAFLIGVPLLLAVARLFGVYTIVRERRCQVYVLFGKVIGILNEPGLCFLWPRLGWKALFVQLDRTLLRDGHAIGPGVPPQPAA